MKGGISMKYCSFCGSELIKDEPTGLYECNICDTIYTINSDEIKYLKNASLILAQMMDDIKIMEEMSPHQF